MSRGIFSSILSFVVIGFLIWIFIAGSNETRMARACRPVGWIGNLMESVMLMVAPKGVDTTQSVFGKIEYGCQFSLWRMIYEDAYLQQGGIIAPNNTNQQSQSTDAVQEVVTSAGTVIINASDSKKQNSI
jgi:hypothetical protein